MDRSLEDGCPASVAGRATEEDVRVTTEDDIRKEIEQRLEAVLKGAVYNEDMVRVLAACIESVIHQHGVEEVGEFIALTPTEDDIRNRVIRMAYVPRQNSIAFDIDVTPETEK
jgi:alanine racemase